MRFQALFIVMAVAAAFSVPAGAQMSADWCRPKVAPKINVVPTTKPVKLDHSQTQAQLGGHKIDTVNPYGSEVISDVGGLMRGGVKVKYNITFDGVQNNTTQESCIWYKKITVNVQVDPTILIAKEYPKGSCMYNAVLGHENKHVLVDRAIVKKYAKTIGLMLQQELKSKPAYGPFPTQKANVYQATMEKVIGTIMEGQITKLEADRAQYQQAVDSIQEYQRVNTMCGEKNDLIGNAVQQANKAINKLNAQTKKVQQGQ